MKKLGYKNIPYDEIVALQRHARMWSDTFQCSIEEVPLKLKQLKERWWQQEFRIKALESLL